MASVDLKLILYQKVIISMINMKVYARDAQSAEIQRIIEDTINLPAINNLDYQKEPITASFGLLLLYAQIYRYTENKEEAFNKIVEIINEIRPFMNSYAQHQRLALFGGLCDLGVSLLAINKETGATFYYHLKQMQKEDKYASVKEEITTIYHENRGRYGYRRITAELRKRNFLLNHKTVQRLMKELGLVCRVRMKKYRSYKGEVGKIAPNLLNRDFHAEKPNQKWVTDVTEFSLFGEKLYLSPILDLCSSDLVSYTISDRPALSMVTTMLDEAFAKIPAETNLILHSDQGWQYQHKQYQQMLREKGVRQSMSRKGNCLDNAVIENFFGLLKSELLYLQEFRSMEHFKLELIEYLDYYNNRRIKAKLKGLPPAIHRQQALSAA